MKNGAALFDGTDDAGETVIEQDHVRRLLCDVCAGDAHRDANMSGFQLGRIVDPVAGHRDDVALLFEPSTTRIF